MKNILCVIPSRIASTRLPRKPLQLIQGKPMIQWVLEQAQACPLFKAVVVATDSDEIASVVNGAGGKAILTSPHIQTGSDRIAEVAKHYPEMDVIVNLQGDEPFMRPSMLATLLEPFIRGESIQMATLASPLEEAGMQDPGVVKVLVDRFNDALYFSRAPIPYYREMGKAPVYHHLGIYAFSRDFLLHYTSLEQTPLEKIECLEQLRALENGFKIRVCLTPYRTIEINTPEELARAQHFVMKDQE